MGQELGRRGAIEGRRGRGRGKGFHGEGRGLKIPPKNLATCVSNQGRIHILTTHRLIHVSANTHEHTHKHTHKQTHTHTHTQTYLKGQGRQYSKFKSCLSSFSRFQKERLEPNYLKRFCLLSLSK